MASEATTATWTTTDSHAKGPLTHPVVAIRILPKGPIHRLPELCDDNGTKKRWLLIGRGTACDIVVRKKDAPRKDWQTVNRRHCMLCCARTGHVLVKRSSEGKNGTRVNDVRLDTGRVEIRPGDVLYLGKVRLMALSQAMLDSALPPRPKLVAADPHTFYGLARKAYGSSSKAAKRFKIDPSTLARWLRKKRFASDD